MTLSRAVVSDWYWAGGPGRRLLISGLITAVVILVPFPGPAEVTRTMLVLLIGWDLGSWFMDTLYVHRISKGRTDIA